MKRIVCFGEALIDFLNTGEIPDGKLALNTFTQYPGGAPANVAVAAAKLGGNAAFAGQVGDDPFGHFIVEALELYGVDTALTAFHPDAPTALAFVFLDDNGERSFAFRRDRTADVVFGKDQVDKTWFTGESIVHFCSNTLTEAPIADVTRHVVAEALKYNAFVSFDVNLRHNLWPSDTVDAGAVNDLVYRSHMAKFSREEIDYLSDGDRESYLSRCFDQGLGTALVTDGPGDILMYSEGCEISVSPPAVTAVDTTGGGDAFVGAVLYGLSLLDDPIGRCSDAETLRDLVAFAARCGAIAVSRKGAFPSFPEFDEVSEYWTG